MTDTIYNILQQIVNYIIPKSHIKYFIYKILG